MLPFKTFHIHFDRLELDGQVVVRPDYVSAGDWVLLLDMWRDVSENFGRSGGEKYTEAELEGEIEHELSNRDLEWQYAKDRAVSRLEGFQGLYDELYEDIHSLIDGIEP